MIRNLLYQLQNIRNIQDKIQKFSFLDPRKGVLENQI